MLLSLSALEVGYAGRAILPPLELTLAAGEIWALIGRNGSGKSTLLRTILGLQAAVGGSVKRRTNLFTSFVPQRGDYDLTVPSRVIDLVRGGIDRRWSFLSPRFALARRRAVASALEVTGMTALARRPFAELSEGQKQRVLIARAIVSDPELVVLDEPTSAMDALAEDDIFSLLRQLSISRGLGILIASHHLGFLPKYATHAILVDADDGLVVVGSVGEVIAGKPFRRRFGSVLDGSGPAEPARG